MNLEKKAIVILGMHRSGTSALTRVLNLCGASLPKTLMSPVQGDNEAGFWESYKFMGIHDELLQSVNSAWDDFSPFPDSWYDSDQALKYKEKMLTALKDEFGDSSLFVLKDPRICRFIPFWLDVLKDFSAQPYFVITVRHPLEVAASLKKRNNFETPKSLLLWLEHFLSAEKNTRNLPRCFVTYEQLLFDWQGVINKIENNLSITFPLFSHHNKAEIEDFISPDLHHHQEQLKNLSNRSDIVSWIPQVYDWAIKASQDDNFSLDTQELDKIYADYLEADKAYGLIIAKLKRQEFAQINEIKIVNQKLEQDLTKKTQELLNAQDEIKVKDECILVLESAIKNKENNLTQLELEIKQKSDRLSELESAIIKRDNRIENLENQLENLTNQNLQNQQTFSYKFNQLAQNIFDKFLLIPKIIYWLITFQLPKKWREEKIYSTIKKSGMFDRDYYLLTYPDVAEAGVDPLRHYVNYYYEGRNPNPNFDSSFYLQANPDVARAKMHPFFHYVLYGKDEQRATKPSY